jgi:hypothetical protein
LRTPAAAVPAQLVVAGEATSGSGALDPARVARLGHEVAIALQLPGRDPGPSVSRIPAGFAISAAPST